MNEKIAPHFECDYCGRVYKIKSFYDKHALVCNILSKTPAQRLAEEEEHSDTPTMHEMYMLIQTLTQKYVALEKKMDKMSAWANKNKKTLNVVEWLNTNAVDNMMDFNEWCSTVLSITDDDMELVVKHNFSEGMNQIIQRLISTHGDTMPIKSFEQREHTFYIFKVNEWTLMTNEEFERFVNKMTKGLMTQLKLWQDKYIDRICQDGFTEKYIERVKKITGGNLSQEQQYAKVKHHLYVHLKTNLKHLVQYEYEF